ncbi:hypothetical protein K469DRAFT_70825 [Zopfia rhizophila CBS 207.26]|uniref:Uncharacterized protein n=1 Tax=Zopfia rhizophila CBS 207.26 TaxID=1314779 RepID=A0A6A6EFW5_9PEZI|nr:hypothetical protein K469DRAFT_70825 [Zopfia rhizophila CBS 207.26]
MSFDENDIKADALIGFASVLEGCTDCSISETLCWNRFYDDKQNKIISSPEIKIDSVQRVRYWSEPMTNEMLRILQRKDILNTAIELGGLFPGFEFSRTSVSSKLQRLKRAYKSQKLMISEYDSVVEQRKSQRIQQSTQQDASRPRKRVEKTRITRSTRSGGPREAGEKTESDAEIRSDTESISSLNMANDLILESLYPNKTFSLRQRHHK